MAIPLDTHPPISRGPREYAWGADDYVLYASGGVRALRAHRHKRLRLPPARTNRAGLTAP